MKKKVAIVGAILFVALAAVGAATGSEPTTTVTTPPGSLVTDLTLYGSRMTDTAPDNIRDYGLTESFTMDPGEYWVVGATEFCLDGYDGDPEDEAWADARGADDMFCLTLNPKGDDLSITKFDIGLDFYFVGPRSTLINVYR
jgi:hypothetical protein